MTSATFSAPGPPLTSVCTGANGSTRTFRERRPAEPDRQSTVLRVQTIGIMTSRYNSHYLLKTFVYTLLNINVMLFNSLLLNGEE